LRIEAVKRRSNPTSFFSFWRADCARLKEKFGVEIEDLRTVPEYADFVKSPEYQAWLKAQSAEPPAGKKAG